MPRKRKNKRSQKFSELAHRRWSKTVDSTVDDSNSVTETQNHVAAVAGVVDEIESNIVIEGIETTNTGDEQVESSVNIISGYLTTEDDQARTEGSTESITDLTAENSVCEDVVFYEENETESTVTANEAEIDHITGEAHKSIVANYSEIFQLGYHKVQGYNSAKENDSDDDSSTSTVSRDSSSEYCPTPMKRAKVNPIELGNRVFVCQTTQLDEFLNQINATSLCYTPNCVGKLVPISIKHVGLGGSLLVKFSCTGCSERMLNLTSSIEIEFSKRTVCSLAMQVAFIAAGCMHAQYSKVLKQNMGISAVNSTTFYETIKLLDPIVATLLTEMCTAAQDEMKALDSSTVGSWQRAITTSDGAWLTRGRFSQNCTFTIRNYINNSLLYFVHLSMRGADKDKLYHGTSKGAEGFAASIAFKAAKEEGMHIEVQWQDGDSSSAKSFREHYSDEERSKVMLCGGHVARAHTKQLTELARQKSFTVANQDKYKKKFPGVTTVKCHCPKRHHKKCGCISKAFLRAARTNFFYCLLQAGTDPKAFESSLNVLGTYHACDIHSWEDGKCGFHPQKSCSCGKCEDELACEGEDYHTKNPLTCPFHKLAYQIECSNRASQASQIIHKELGRGHSNYPEASHNVLTRFRAKDKYLQRIHYTMSTNMGLLQSNMTWLTKNRGLSYHWLLDLFKRLNLPIFDGMAEGLKKANEIREKNLNKKQSDSAKEKRTNWKKARAQEHQERKQWMKRQTVYHTYGTDDDEDDDEMSDEEGTTTTTTRRATASWGCKCGSYQHRYTSHRLCPLNKKKQASVRHESDTTSNKVSSSSDTEEEIAQLFCDCGDRATHSRSCPLYPRNYNVRNHGKK